MTVGTKFTSEICDSISDSYDDAAMMVIVMVTRERSDNQVKLVIVVAIGNHKQAKLVLAMTMEP